MTQVRGAAALACLSAVLWTALPARAAEDRDVAAAILRCYHPSAEMLSYRIHGERSLAARYDADDAQVYDISFRGFLTGNAYDLSIAFLIKTRNGIQQFRGEILSDTAAVPANPDCRLRNWANSR